MKRTTAVILTVKAVAICLVIGVIGILPTKDAVGGDKEQLDLAFMLVEKTEGSKMFIELVNSFMEPYLERYEPAADDGNAAPNPLRELLMEEFRAAEDELKWNLAEIYAKHFSEAELREAVRFFFSPAGKAWLENSSLIFTEGEQVGYEWAKLLTERVLHKFEASAGKKISE